MGRHMPNIIQVLLMILATDVCIVSQVGVHLLQIGCLGITCSATTIIEAYFLKLGLYSFYVMRSDILRILIASDKFN